MKVKVLNTDGKETGREVELNDNIFAIEPNNQVIYEDIRSYLANQRSGTASTKGRSQVRGGGRKAYRQKGTGMARRGSIRSPLLKGGGTVFGPQPRSYQVKLTKKMKALARKSALSYKMKENGILMLEDFDYEVPRTKSVVTLLKALDIEGKKVLLLTSGHRPMVYRSGRNIPGIKILEAAKPPTYDILHADVLVIQEGGLKELEASLNGNVVEVEA